jgi:purine-binding chemotaxis protein CheW
MTIGSHDAIVAFWLLCRTGDRFYALPLDQVAETMRPLPIEKLVSAHPFIRGLSIVRGLPIPVLDLGAMFGDQERGAQRLVRVKLADRCIGLLVESVSGVRAMAPDSYHQVPPLLRDAAGDVISAIGVLDKKLLLFLQTSRMAPQAMLVEAGLDPAVS